MKSNPNQLRKIIYALVIVGLFGAMWPYGLWLNKVKSEKDLGEATIGQIDEDHIFYLQTRAIAKADAVKILSRGFAQDVAFRVRVRDKQLREMMTELVDRQFESLKTASVSDE